MKEQELEEKEPKANARTNSAPTRDQFSRGSRRGDVKRGAASRREARLAALGALHDTGSQAPASTATSSASTLHCPVPPSLLPFLPLTFPLSLPPSLSTHR